MFKSILNTLQKNVIGATLFGKLTATEKIMEGSTIPLEDLNDRSIIIDTINNTSEDIDTTADIINECDDPLSDPLALDDSSINGEVEVADATNSHLTDLGPANGQIILIDVNSLRKVEQNAVLDGGDGETETEYNYESLQLNVNETTEEGVPSDGSDSGLASDIASDGSIVEVRPQISEIISKRSCLKRRSSEHMLSDSAKRAKRNIKFEGVSVYYFQRTQGNSCVPSQGGCTLGMARHHMHHRTFTLAEHAAEQRRIHRLQDMNANNSSTDDSDTDDEPSENSGSDLDMESNGFLQPVPARQRRVMLKTAGVLKIDSNEKDECRVIRTSREFCGCNCRGYCDPDTCFCSLSGIQCQVDRSNFPCGCSRHGCDNVVGRVEFDPERVRIHFIHTILRLELENKQNRSEEIVFKNDVSRQWHPQTRPPDFTTSSIVDYPHCNYVYDNNVSHRSDASSSSVDRPLIESLSAHQDSSNLVELTNRPSDDTLDLHYDYRNDYNTDSIINSTVVPTNPVDVDSNYDKMYGNHDTATNSFNSTFNEFVERTYCLGSSDYQQHSTYLASTYNGESSTANNDNIETLPVNQNTELTLETNKRSINENAILQNDGIHMSNVVISNGIQYNTTLSKSVSIATNLLNNVIDVEQVIPSILVNVDSEKLINNSHDVMRDDEFASNDINEVASHNQIELNNL